MQPRINPLWSACLQINKAQFPAIEVDNQFGYSGNPSKRNVLVSGFAPRFVEWVIAVISWFHGF